MKNVPWKNRGLRRFCVVMVLTAWCSGPGNSHATAQLPELPGQVTPDESPVHEAYLFSHMTDQDYGGLYYSVSLDGLRWTPLNGGRRVLQEYHGHSCIVTGHDGRYYLVGNESDADPTIHFWCSSDLIHWERYSDYTPDLKKIPEYPTAMQRIGAPKLFYDQDSSQYLLTWHTPHEMG
ncbi:MAG: glycosyl hydrolase family 43, partial [Planctomycetia bacterium]|nr:glycosyl hydrolase family 43 [Planctomycetia bacterium]